jgi:nitroreductase
VRSTYDVPDEWVPVAAIAVGFPAEEEPEKRRRKSLEDFVFAGGFSRPAPFAEGD